MLVTADLFEIVAEQGCCGTKILTVTRKKVLAMLISVSNGGFDRKIGTFWGGGGYCGTVLVPTKCLPVNARQTHRTQRQEKVSPNAKKACVYGTSVNIG